MAKAVPERAPPGGGGGGGERSGCDIDQGSADQRVKAQAGKKRGYHHSPLFRLRSFSTSRAKPPTRRGISEKSGSSPLLTMSRSLFLKTPTHLGLQRFCVHSMSSHPTNVAQLRPNHSPRGRKKGQRNGPKEKKMARKRGRGKKGGRGGEGDSFPS